MNSTSNNYNTNTNINTPQLSPRNNIANKSKNVPRNVAFWRTNSKGDAVMNKIKTVNTKPQNFGNMRQVISHLSKLKKQSGAKRSHKRNRSNKRTHHTKRSNTRTHKRRH